MLARRPAQAWTVPCLLLLVGALGLSAQAAPGSERETADLAAARALFVRNLEAIRAGDREAYLACYLESERFLRGGPEGLQAGYDAFAASLDEHWPERLADRDLQLRWLAPGLVVGCYRYHVVFDGVPSYGVSERLFLETPAGWRIALSTAHPAPAGTTPPALLLRGASLHDGLGGPPLPRADVLLRGGRIEAIAEEGQVDWPAEVTVVDLDGLHLVPGLIDTHVHYAQTGWADGRPDAFDLRARFPYPEVVAESARQPERAHVAFLRAGITTVLDAGGYPWTRTLDAGPGDPWLRPHVLAAGPLLATWVPPALAVPDQACFVLLQDEAQVRATVASHAAAGSDVIKLWLVRTDRPPESWHPLVGVAGEAARAAGLPLVVHATDLETARLAVAAGARLLVHSVDDAAVDEAFISDCLAIGTAYCPTLTVVQGYLTLAAGPPLPPDLQAQLADISPELAERVRAGTGLPSPEPRLLAERTRGQTDRRATMDANLRALHAAGVRVVLGTDAGNPLTFHGASVAAELQAMQDAGLPPAAVLRAATADAAAALGLPDRGRLVPGAVADLLVLEEDPLQDMRRAARPLFVVRGGVMHRREDLRVP